MADELALSWWLDLAGALVQIVGAGILVAATFRTRFRIQGIPDTWKAELPEKLRDVIASQAITELVGFFFLALGLILQVSAGLAD